MSPVEAPKIFKTSSLLKWKLPLNWPYTLIGEKVGKGKMYVDVLAPFTLKWKLKDSIKCISGSNNIF